MFYIVVILIDESIFLKKNYPLKILLYPLWGGTCVVVFFNRCYFRLTSNEKTPIKKNPYIHSTHVLTLNLLHNTV